MSKTRRIAFQSSSTSSNRQPEAGPPPNNQERTRHPSSISQSSFAFRSEGRKLLWSAGIFRTWRNTGLRVACATSISKRYKTSGFPPRKMTFSIAHPGIRCCVQRIQANRVPSWKRLIRFGPPRRQSYSTGLMAGQDLGPNPGLESVISQGIESLERTAADVQSKTRHASLSRETTGSNAPSQQGPSPRQLAEAQRIMDVASECLEDLCERGVGNMYLGGEPIVILDVRVNTNSKQAKVFWTLPYGVLSDSRLTPQSYQRLMAKVRETVEDRGGGKLLAKQVHGRLRSYYPPRLKLLPATDEMVSLAMAEYHDDASY